jgi:LPS export ABC transporter protein LptC
MPFRSPGRALGALAFALGVAACAHGPAPVNSTSPSAPPLAAAATAVPIRVVSEASGGRFVTLDQTVVERGRRRKQYEIRALGSEADRSANGDATATFEQPHIVFHSTDGTTLVADAPRASVTQRTKDVFMSGGVRAQTATGTILTCRTLHYDGRTERIHGDGDVRLVDPAGWQLAGDHLDGNVRLDQLRITQGNAR